MKFSNILLSVFLHVGLIVGIVCGLPCKDEVETEQVKPVFFEILEECVAASEPVEPVRAPQETEPETKPTPKKPTNSIYENSIRNEFSDEVDGADAGNGDEKVEASDKDEAFTKTPYWENGHPARSKYQRAGRPLSQLRESDTLNIGSFATASDEKGEVEDEDKKKAIADNDEHREESEVVKPTEQDQAKVVSVPIALNRIVPVYPRSARRRGREGAVTVEVWVSDSGEVSGVEVIAGSGHKDLDSAAISAVRTARFAPATEDGVRVNGRLRLTFEFKLR